MSPHYLALLLKLNDPGDISTHNQQLGPLVDHLRLHLDIAQWDLLLEDGLIL